MINVRVRFHCCKRSTNGSVWAVSPHLYALRFTQLISSSFVSCLALWSLWIYKPFDRKQTDVRIDMKDRSLGLRCFSRIANSEVPLTSLFFILLRKSISVFLVKATSAFSRFVFLDNAMGKFIHNKNYINIDIRYVITLTLWLKMSTKKIIWSKINFAFYKFSSSSSASTGWFWFALA